MFNVNLAFRSWSWYSSAADRGSFVGMNNFIRILSEPRFWNSFAVTFEFVIIAVVFELICGLGLALLLNAEFKGRSVFRTLFLVPMMLAPTVIGTQWKYLLSSNFGIINYLIAMMGIEPPNWLSQPALALPVVALVDVWAFTPLMAIILLAGLQNIPKELYEAANVDGATRWQQFTRLTLPIISTEIALSILIRLADIFKTFDLIYVMTGGGPSRATENLGLYAYRIAFSEGQMGVAAAVAFIITLIGIAIAALVMKMIKTEVKLY